MSTINEIIVNEESHDVHDRRILESIKRFVDKQGDDTTQLFIEGVRFKNKNGEVGYIDIAGGDSIELASKLLRLQTSETSGELKVNSPETQIYGDLKIKNQAGERTIVHINPNPEQDIDPTTGKITAGHNIVVDADSAVIDIQKNITIESTLGEITLTNSAIAPSLKIDKNSIKLRRNQNINFALLEKDLNYPRLTEGGINIVAPEIRWIEKVKSGASYVDKEHLLSTALAKVEEYEYRLVRLELLMSDTVVDLGLPSGKLWAKCNLGAEKETDFGKYYQWGATVGYKDNQALAHSTWSTAPFNNGSSDYDESYFKANKYRWISSSDTLKLAYDAAWVETSGRMRMPTNDEINELLDNTEVVYVTNFNNTGVSGTKIMNRLDTSKYIFIPEGGYYSNGEYNRTATDLWTSSLVPDDHLAGNYEDAFNAFGANGYPIAPGEPTGRFEAAGIRPIFVG